MKQKSGWRLAIMSGIVLVILSPAMLVSGGTLVGIVFIYPVLILGVGLIILGLLLGLKESDE